MSYQDQIDLVRDLLTQLKLSPAILVGHSFGGTLALGVARRYPQDVAKMVLVAPGAGGLRSKTMDMLNARYVRFSHLPVIRTVIEAETLPKTELNTVEGNHMIPYTHPEAVADQIRRAATTPRA
jgi:alpha-beta hydrolase superfamily lysophospholipase